VGFALWGVFQCGSNVPGKLNKAQLKYSLNPGLKFYVDLVYV
jgi:hypothetical protein